MTETVDTIIEARWIVPVDPAGVLEHHAIVVGQGRIVAMPTIAESRRYSPKRRIVLDRHVMIPGLVKSSW